MPLARSVPAELLLARNARGRASLLHRLVAFLMALLVATIAIAPPAALAVSKVVRVSADDDAIDLATAVEYYGAKGDKLQVSTAPGPDGIVRRIEVSALEAGAQPSWMVVALTNDSDEQLTRLIVAPHFVSSVRGSSGPISAPRASRRSPPARATRPSGRTRSTRTFFNSRSIPARR